MFYKEDLALVGLNKAFHRVTFLSTISTGFVCVGDHLSFVSHGILISERHGDSSPSLYPALISTCKLVCVQGRGTRQIMLVPSS